MRKFSGITNTNSPDAVNSDTIQPDQIMLVIKKSKCNSYRTGTNIPPYGTEFRNINK